MSIADLVKSEAVIGSLKASGKKQALQELSKKASEVTGLEARLVFDNLLEREKLGTTGVGQGVAIPHARFSGLKKVCGLFARLEQAVDFDSLDDQPVDLVFVILAPEEAGAEHLKALARVSRLLRNHTACEKLRGTDQPDALYALLTEDPASYAA